jgi:hypothetical protein
MKKIVFFIPAITFAIFFSGIMIAVSPSAISLIVYFWIGLFAVSGILLSKGLFWGGLLGVLPGIHLIYMSTIDTGQIMNIELPIGVIVVAFYLICCSFMFYKKRKMIN